MSKTDRIILQEMFYREPTQKNYEALEDACRIAVENHLMNHTQAEFVLKKAREEIEE